MKMVLHQEIAEKFNSVDLLRLNKDVEKPMPGAVSADSLSPLVASTGNMLCVAWILDS